MAVFAGYAAWLTSVDWLDWREKARHPKRQPNPWWLVPLIWLVFAGMATATIVIGKGLIWK